jgi:hypothetical protein
MITFALCQTPLRLRPSCAPIAAWVLPCASNSAIDLSLIESLSPAALTSVRHSDAVIRDLLFDAFMSSFRKCAKRNNHGPYRDMSLTSFSSASPVGCMYPWSVRHLLAKLDELFDIGIVETSLCLNGHKAPDHVRVAFTAY